MRDSLWAIACYFNPLHYQSRLTNYGLFRSRLNVPLVTVEWARPGEFELGDDDGDVMVRVSGRDVLWQKERMLNIALRSVPKSCKYVAWLDGDVVLDRDDWSQQAIGELQHNAMVQPFERFIELPSGGKPECARAVREGRRGYSICSRYGRAVLRSSVLGERRSLRLHHNVGTGFAWAAHKGILERAGLYDRLIIGGGSRSMVCAAVGRPEEAARFANMNARQRSDFLSWAEVFGQAVNGRVGFCEGTLYHLWHGDLVHRNVIARHDGLAEFDFDPQVDITVDDNGSWKWNSEKPDLHRFVREYFLSRSEDG